MAVIWMVTLSDIEEFQVHSSWDTEEQAKTIAKQLRKIATGYSVNVEEETVHSTGHIETFAQISASVYVESHLVLIHRETSSFRLAPYQTNGFSLAQDENGGIERIWVDADSVKDGYKTLAEILHEHNLPLMARKAGDTKKMDLSTYLA